MHEKIQQNKRNSKKTSIVTTRFGYGARFDLYIGCSVVSLQWNKKPHIGFNVWKTTATTTKNTKPQTKHLLNILQLNQHICETQKFIKIHGPHVKPGARWTSFRSRKWLGNWPKKVKNGQLRTMKNQNCLIPSTEFASNWANDPTGYAWLCFNRWNSSSSCSLRSDSWINWQVSSRLFDTIFWFRKTPGFFRWHQWSEQFVASKILTDSGNVQKTHADYPSAFCFGLCMKTRIPKDSPTSSTSNNSPNLTRFTKALLRRQTCDAQMQRLLGQTPTIPCRMHHPPIFSP